MVKVSELDLVRAMVSQNMDESVVTDQVCDVDQYLSQVVARYL